MTGEQIAEIAREVAGWHGEWRHVEITDGGELVADQIVFMAQRCVAKTCDCSHGECGFVLVEDTEDHIARSVVVLLNAVAPLLARVEGTDGQ